VCAYQNVYRADNGFLPSLMFWDLNWHDAQVFSGDAHGYFGSGGRHWWNF